MAFIKNFLDFMSDVDFAVPLGQVIIFVIINSICLLFGKYKTGLLVSYCFVLYWGFIFNLKYFVSVFGSTAWGLPVYIFAGVAMAIIIVIKFLQHDE
ncbi:MAG: hypothetical protein N2738_08275 [Thermodesulfovibrionales bacterium]|nr:hypothetical protein [Thermodesulfovibrionales bacterium]